MKVWIDGKIVEGSEARVPVLDHGFLYGDGVFEGIRVLGRRVLALDAHLARLAASARAIDLEIPGGTAGARAVVLETLRALDRDEAYVRLLVSRGEGALGVDPTTCPRPRMVCIADGLRLYPAETLARGIDLVTASVRRPGPDVLDPRVKSMNYLNNAMAKLEARRQGADEALLLNAAGLVAEAAVANVFVVEPGPGGARDGQARLATPPASDGALAGITRAAVLELAGALGIPAGERRLSRYDLWAAEEVFLTGSGAGIVPVRSLDGRPVGGAGEDAGAAVPGPVTRRILEAFPEHARRCGAPF